ncbi:MAG TPA: M56 family metallopeptidase, partial [Gammaproteobacteria bacterium]|nr:M56 family metallopeptidase [Gammaproteobacteria bacterium]
MSDLSQAPLISHLGWTLIHSLWQGILVGVLYACLSRMLGRTAPQVRYSLALAMLFMFILLPLITFYLAGWNNESLPLTPPAQIEYMATSSTAAHAPLWQTLADRLSPFTAWVVIIWLSGVLLMGVRALWSWRLAASLRRALPFPAAHPWQPLLHELIGKMHVKATVQLIASARAHAPMVMGWLKPVILIPPSAVCGLSWQQAEMILAHELSHIRRHDYLINLLQVMVETLLFYHPVVHWISRDARNQREFCCDDAVMQTCGDRVGYLKALTELEYGRLHATCNVAANGGLLLNRAYRLAYHSEPKERLAGRTAVLLTLSVLVITAALMRSHSIDHSFRSARSMAMMPIRTQFPEARKPQPLEKHPVSDVPIKLAPTRITPTPAMALPKLESLRIIPVVVAAIPLTPPPPSRLDTRLASTNPPSSKLVIIAAQPLPQPAYPYQAWRDDLGGTVQASFRISETGQVKDINTQMVDGPVVLAGAVRAAIS